MNHWYPRISQRMRNIQAGAFNTPPRVARERHSSRRSAKAAPAARCRAISTSQQSAVNRLRSARMISRKRRRTRLRTTAPPTRRDVMRPMRAPDVVALRRTLSTMNFPCNEVPSRFRFWNSPVLARRAALGNPVPLSGGGEVLDGVTTACRLGSGTCDPNSKRN